MVCSICKRRATGACSRCGRGYCAAHGRDLCRDCASPLSVLPAGRTYRAVVLSSLALAGLAVVYLQAWPTPPTPQPRAVLTVPSARPVGSPIAPEAAPGTVSPAPQRTGTSPPTPTTTPQPPPTPTTTPPVQHTVVAGDTLVDLAARYGTTVEAIARANNLRDAHALQIGQVLTIPR